MKQEHQLCKNQCFKNTERGWVLWFLDPGDLIFQLMTQLCLQQIKIASWDWKYVQSCICRHIVDYAECEALNAEGDTLGKRPLSTITFAIIWKFSVRPILQYVLHLDIGFRVFIQRCRQTEVLSSSTVWNLLPSCNMVRRFRQTVQLLPKPSYFNQFTDQLSGWTLTLVSHFVRLGEGTL